MEDYTANEEFVLIVDTSLLRIAKLRFTYIDPAYRGNVNQPKAHRCSPQSSRPNSPFLLPVPFRSGSCVVLVGPSHPRWIPSWRLPYIVPPPLVSDSAMYHQVWPEVKRGASVIIRQCRFKRERFSYAGFSGKCFTAGIFRGSTLLEGQPFYSQVIV